jgi:hypothetical protein
MRHQDIRAEVRALVVSHARLEEVVPSRTVHVVLSRAVEHACGHGGRGVDGGDVHLVRGMCVADETRGHFGDRVVLVRNELEGLAELVFEVLVSCI